MSLIVALAVAGGLAALALAALPSDPTAAAIARVRAARGLAAGGWRDRLDALPLVRSWRPVDAETLRLAGLAHVSTSELAASKIGTALAAGLLALLVLGANPLALLAAYAAFVAPTLWVERRAAASVAARNAAVLPFLDRLAAAAAAGATVEQALALGADQAGPLAPLLRDAVRRAGLGLSLFEACAEVASAERVDALRDLARELARARRGGRPLRPVLDERREVLRLAHRAARLEAASRVDGSLSLVLVLAYLPALLLLVVVPLFLGLLAALG